MIPYAFLLLLISLVASSSAKTCTVTKNSAFFLELSTDDLYEHATNRNRVGDCYISEARFGACDLYVKSAISGVNGDKGWPKTTDNSGTGCVKAPDYGKKVSTCFYSDNSYLLTQAERDSFCTEFGKENAVAQLRHAIRNNACSIPTTGVTSQCAFGSPGCHCEDPCTRTTPTRGWSVPSIIRLDRVRRCRNRFPFCNSVITRSEYNVFDRSHNNRQQKKLYLSMVNHPKRSVTKNIVIAIAGQQRQDGKKSGTTGQYDDYKSGFDVKRGHREKNVDSNSMVNSALRTGYFAKEDTFVGLVYDARYNYEYRRKVKNRIVDAYYNFIRDRLTSNSYEIQTIYLIGHSRGGCLSMRLAARLTAALPKARVIIHSFDAVCTSAKAIFPWTESEFGVSKDFTIRNIFKLGWFTLTTDIERELPNHECLSVRSFLSGSDGLDEFAGFRVNPKAVRGFGHYAHKDTQNELTTAEGFDWYTQSFHTEDHNAIESVHFGDAVNHIRTAFTELPCECGNTEGRGVSPNRRRPIRGNIDPRRPRIDDSENAKP